jgi:hypothetical protein
MHRALEPARSGLGLRTLEPPRCPHGGGALVLVQFVPRVVTLVKTACGRQSSAAPMASAPILPAEPAPLLRPARGQAILGYIVIHLRISYIPMNDADTPKLLVSFTEPYVDHMMHIADMDLGALTPGAVATPRQFRPLAGWIRWGGAWTPWTAPLRRGLLHGVYMEIIDTLRMW